uniref:BH4_AAA_HYDROXYL_2 domain-containing protein n=1 Tax=Elaeophora elaphi TaxID=1147741 RepID=A0A158Q755_9BILA
MIRFVSFGTLSAYRQALPYLGDHNYTLSFRNFLRKNIISFHHSFYATPSNKGILLLDILMTFHCKVLFAFADIDSGKWYPKQITDLDYICNKVITYDPTSSWTLDADHPSFKDKEYRKRREWFLDIANDYKQGTIYRDLKTLHGKLACKEYLDNFKLLEEQCGYSDKQIPQLEDVSKYLQTKTGFTLRPCGGYLTPRNFLAGLAFRVFCCTQYLRHHSDPHYTPEPDLCHEMLGHMAMFLNPAYAQLSQEIGIASLGSSEKDCNALIHLYFFTIEFGLLVDGEKFDEKKRNLKVYGAGLLSCFDELKFCVSSEAKIYQFEPADVIEMEPEVTKFQKGYFYSKSINEAFHKIRSYVSTIEKPFSV